VRPGPAVALRSPGVGADRLAGALRRGDPAVLGRIVDGRLLLDPRTMRDDEVPAVARAVRGAREVLSCSR
jgi:L-seryl-tRNA(Ser) seleniumtransferase